MYNYAEFERFVKNYQWYLKEIQAIEAEIAAAHRRINEGLASRDTFDPNWEQQLLDKLTQVKDKVKLVENIIDNIPETPKMMPCKLYLRLHMLAGYTLTDTAMQMDVSLSTLGRIRQRCIKYFENQDIIA